MKDLIGLLFVVALLFAAGCIKREFDAYRDANPPRATRR